MQNQRRPPLSPHSLRISPTPIRKVRPLPMTPPEKEEKLEKSAGFRGFSMDEWGRLFELVEREGDFTTVNRMKDTFYCLFNCEYDARKMSLLKQRMISK